MCQPQKKCATCQKVQDRSTQQAGVFSCGVCSANFQQGRKL